MWPASHPPHSVTEKKWGWNGSWLALQIIFLTQITECFLHKPGAKRGRCKKGGRRCRRGERGATFSFCYQNWRFLWETLSQERKWGPAAEADVSSNKPGSRNNNHKSPRLSHFLRITLQIYKSSPSLRCKTNVPLDATETGQEVEVEDV